VFPGTECEEKANIGFKYNEIGHSLYVGVLFNNPKNRCYHMGYVSVFNTEDGVTLNTKVANDGYDATEMITAECKINLKLHS